MIATLLFLTAYACSGLAGLIYEVSWTRLLTLYMGHSTAAASAVVAAFMGGLAIGAGVGGRVAARWSRSQCLRGYIALEGFVVLVAILLPFELALFTNVLRLTYHNGDGGLVFSAVRLASCLAMMFLPAAALGATFPVAIRWFVDSPTRAGRAGGLLYAVNTAGAAAGALVAGFVLIPVIGVSATTHVGMAASAVAMLAIVALWRLAAASHEAGAAGASASLAPGGAGGPGRAGAAASSSSGGNPRAKKSAIETVTEQIRERPWLAAVVLGMTGFASLVFEIAWTRVLAMSIGPTVYAFSATLAVLIGGMALGSALGSWLAGRVKTPALWLGAVLALSAIAASGASAIAGRELPMRIAREVAAAPDSFAAMLTRDSFLVAALIAPAAAGFGAAFPLAFATLSTGDAAKRLGLVYAINTAGAVAGSLAAGFFLIPVLGLEQTLRLVTVLLIAATGVVIFFGRLTETGRTIAGLIGVAAVAMLAFAPPWDRELLASGGYIYAPYEPKGIDLETALKAGQLLYYQDGATATVSVKKLTGTISLAIDGKVDASTRSDMLTQRLVAHIPLLLHENPKEICIIGLGSGVTLGSALRHPVEHADLIELSPEVVQASSYFAEQNYHALDDPRTHLIVGDGRSHLLLTDRKYDVIISEPSNPWIAGVASLFTREFFSEARARLAPGGIICQWAHTYNISDQDLRSIVATFRSVFPNGTAWLIGEEDVLLIASTDDVTSRLQNIAKGWSRPGVSADLASVHAVDPFSLLTLFVAGPAELDAYTHGAEVFTDDRSALEFSAPRELHSRGATENAEHLLSLMPAGGGPETVRRAIANATADNWHNRAVMMFKSDMFPTAYDDEVRAIEKDPAHAGALSGLVDAAVMTGRFPDASTRLKFAVNRSSEAPAALVARARLLAATGSRDDAVMTAKEAAQKAPSDPAPLEALAAIYADTANAGELDAVVQTLQRVVPDRAATLYFAAASAFLHNRFDDAADLARKAAKADPSYAAVYDLEGAAELKRGDVKAARAAFEQSRTFNPHDSSAYANIGMIELASGDKAAAHREFTQAVLLDPESESARQGLLEAQQFSR